MATISGELKVYHPIYVDFAGPSSSETSSPNPFTDYYFFVTFSKGTKSYRVPGYFAADGNAAQTSATSGNVWRAIFSPDEVGTWSYRADFRVGTGIGKEYSGTHGATTSFHGETGTFIVSQTDKSGLDLRSKGMLQYVNTGHLRFANGDYWLKGGADSPENFLGYYEFDNTFDQSGGLGTGCLTNGLHRFEPHSGDYPNDGTLWQGKGNNIYGALNYLSSRGVNGLYAISYNIDGGDGRDVWPWTGDGSDKSRFDVSKLDQWRLVMDYANKKGIVWHFLLGEVENQGYMGIDTQDRRVYYKEMVARFSYLNGLYWNLGEEMSGMGDNDQKKLAEILSGFDGTNRSISFHKEFFLEVTDVYTPLNDSSYLTTTSFQGSMSNYHRWTQDMYNDPFNDGRRWVIMGDEQGPIARDYNGREDEFIDGMHAVIMAGGIGCEWYAGYAGSGNDCNGYDDIQTENFRSVESLWDLTKIQRDFYENNNIPWWEMVPNDSHTNAKYGMKKDGSYYIGFRTGGGSTNVTVTNGTYEAFWFNPRTGGSLVTGSITSVSGTGSKNIGEPPSNTGGQWLYILRSTNINPGGGECGCSTTTASFVDSGDGKIIIPAEQPTNGIVGSWTLNAYGSLPGVIGDYIAWDAPGDEFNTAGTDVLEYTFVACRTGTFEIAVRSQLDPNGEDVTEGNDGWITVDTPNEEDFYAYLAGSPTIYPIGSGLTPNFSVNGGSNGYFKFFQNVDGEWSWITQVGEGDGNWDYRPRVELVKGEVYTLKISGRSKKFCIDRIVLFEVNAQTFQNATDVSHPSSACEDSPAGDCVTDLAVACGTTSNTLTWTPPSGYTGFFAVERSTDGGSNWVQIITGLSATISTYTDSSINSSSNYTYRVECTDQPPTGGAKVITLFVDGLNDDVFTYLFAGSTQIPNLNRLKNEGLFTNEAYADYDNTTTLPNYISMMSGRTVSGVGAHNYSSNGASGSDSVNVDSVYDVVRAAGLKSVMLTAKTKVKVITDNSWGGLNLTTYLDGSDATNVNTWVTNAPSEQWDYSCIHIAKLDVDGHTYGWNSPDWMQSVITVDGYIGQILNVVENDPAYKNNTVILLVSDHGGEGTGHTNNTDSDVYRVPFAAWGTPVFDEWNDLYVNNGNSRRPNGGNRREFVANSTDNVIYNADQANLATQLLGLGPISGSVINANQDLIVTEENFSGGGSGSTKILHFTKTNGYDHGTRNLSLNLFQDIATTHGYTIVHDNDGSEFNDFSNLSSYALIVFSNTSGNNILNNTQRSNFENFINSGGNMMGIHAASDTERHSSANNGGGGNWNFYSETLGGSVQCCPNHTNQQFLATVTKLQPSHPTVSNLPGSTQFDRREEYYYWENGYLRVDIDPVLQVEQTGSNSYDAARPHSWIRTTAAGGKVFYTAMGHEHSYYTDDAIFMQHIEDAVVWLMNESNSQAAVTNTENFLLAGYSNTVSCNGGISPVLSANCSGVTESTIPLTFSYSGANTNQLLIIERSINQTTWVTVANVNPFNVSTYTDEGLNAGTTYYYRAKYGGDGLYSATVSCTTAGTGSQCTISELGVDCNNGYPSLSWTYSGDTSGVSITVYRSEDGTNFVQHAVVDATNTEYNDTAATIEGQTYYYRLCCPGFSPLQLTQGQNTTGDCEFGMTANGNGEGLVPNSAISLANKSFTIEFAIQLDRNIVAEGWKDVIFSHQGTDTKFNFHAGKMRWWNGTQDLLEGNQSINVGQPIHVGITFDNTTGVLSFYQDGSFNGSTTVSTNEFAGISIDMIAAKGNEQSVLGGFDEFRFHDEAKDLAYFATYYNSRYNAGTTAFDSVQVLYQFVDEAGSDTISDGVGNNDASVNSGAYSHFDFGDTYFLADSSVCQPPIEGCTTIESCTVPVDVPAPELVGECTFTTQTTITLSFEYNGPIISGEKLILERSLDQDIWIEAAMLEVTETDYVDSGLLLETTYYYRIKYNGGPYSTIVNCTTLTSGATGGATDLSCSSNGLSSITLNWLFTGTTVNNGQITIQRSEDFGKWTNLITKTLPTSKTDSHTDAGLVDNTVYYYRAQYTGENGYSNVVSCSTDMQTGSGCDHDYSIDGGTTWIDFSEGKNAVTVDETISETLGILLREDCGNGCVKIFGPFFPDTSSTVLLNEVNVCDQWVEIYNPSPNDIDISDYYLCAFPNYSKITDLTLLGGSYSVQPGGYCVVEFTSMGSISGEVGLYKNNDDFSNPANIVDYMQYNSGGNARASVAVSANVWDSVDAFVGSDTDAGCTSVGIFPNMSPQKGVDTDSSSWCSQVPSPNSSNNTCIEVVANAIDDEYTTLVNTPITENVATNDFLCNVGVTTWELVTTSVANGTVDSFDTATGAFTFTPTVDFIGIASFQYNLLCDGILADTATVIINVVAEAEPNIQLLDGASAVFDCGDLLIDFGDLAVGAVENASFQIINTGTATLEIVDLDIVGVNAAEFNIVSPTVAPSIFILPNSTINVTVQFAPTIEGAKTATLNITSNDPDTNICPVPLNGVSTPAEGELEATNTNGVVLPCGTGSITINSAVGGMGQGTITITNIGTGDLDLNSFALGGANPGLFTIVSPNTLPITLQPNGSQDIVIDFSPITGGVFNANITIDNTDTDEDPCVINLIGVAGQPDITVENDTGGVIGCGGVVSFGTQVANSTTNIMVVIKNIGNDVLNISSIVVAGQYFGITGAPAGGFTLGVGVTQGFTIVYNPLAEGTHTGTVTINSNAATNPACVINLNGTVLPTGTSAEIDIEDNGTSVGCGATFTIETDVDVIASTVVTIVNQGSGTLEISSLNIGGADADSFFVSDPDINLLPLDISPNGSLDVTVSFQSDVAGNFTSTLSIGNNDTNENPCVVNINANIDGSVADIIGVFDGVDYNCGSSIPYPNTPIDSTSPIVAAIKNIGVVPLEVSNITLTGADADQFTLTTMFTYNITVGAGLSSSTYNIDFTPTTVGTKTATLTIFSDDPNEPECVFTLQGVATVPGTGTGNIHLYDENNTTVNCGDIITLPILTTAELYTYILYVENIGDGDLEIIEHTLTGTGVGAYTILPFAGSLSTTLLPNTVQAFEIVVDSAVEGTYEATVTIISDDPNMPNCDVNFTVDVSDPELQITDESGPTIINCGDTVDFVDFGPISLNTVSTAQITFTNIDALNTLDILSIGLIGGDNIRFSVVTNLMYPESLAPGDSLTIDIEFITDVEGSFTTSLSLTTNQPFNTVCNIPLIASIDAPEIQLVDSGSVDKDCGDLTLDFGVNAI